MNTPSMIVSPSIILLQPHVGGFHASDLDFLLRVRARDTTFFFLATTVAKDLTADCMCGSVVDDEDILLLPPRLFELKVGTW